MKKYIWREITPWKWECYNYKYADRPIGFIEQQMFIEPKIKYIGFICRIDTVFGGNVSRAEIFEFDYAQRFIEATLDILAPSAEEMDTKVQYLWKIRQDEDEHK